MRALLQRVSKGSVAVEGEIVGSCKEGYVILLGVGQNDTEAEADFLAKKISALRVFKDDADKMNLSILDIKGEVLLISQFTLYADCSHGNRPSFGLGAPPAEADRLYQYFAEKLRSYGISVQTGVFGAHMQVEIHNDGPVTIMLEK